MRFQLIEAGTEEVPVPRLGKGLGVSPSGSSPGRAARPLGASARTWCGWPLSARPLRSRRGPPAARAGRATGRTPACRTPASPEAAVGRPG